MNRTRHARRIAPAALAAAVLLAAGCSQPDAPDRPATRPRAGAATAPAGSPATHPAFAQRREDREAMVRQITRYGMEDPNVLAAMRAVPRHAFVPEPLREAAYEDSPLPIGNDQTISQPYIVAEMTRLAKVRPGDRVLEVGSGSGYQAAVLAEITPHVYTIEIVGALARTARETLRRLGYDGVKVRHGDGYKGWPEHAPFHAVVVTCGAPSVPEPLVDQLAPGGRMIIPVGPDGGVQNLLVVEKSRDGETTTRNIMPVRFVPLTREVR